MRLRKTMLALCLMLAALLCTSSVASAVGLRTKLHASFIPYRLGESTTIKFGFDIATPGGAPPPALTGVDLHLPKGMNQNASELGLAICHPAALVARGPGGCSGNSKVGFGTTEVEVVFGDSRVRQKTYVSTFLGPPESSSEILFYSETRSPIASRVIYVGKTREKEEGPFGGFLETSIPLIPTVPEGDYMSTTSFESTIGPLGLTYHRKIDGKTESFRPEGIILPRKCPAKGFRFMVQLQFVDGTHASDRTTVPCPGKEQS